MHLEGDYLFEGPRSTVWELLQDPDVLVTALPGAQKLEKIGDDVYQARLQVRVGPVNGLFDTTVTLTDKVPPERYTMQVDSKGSTGFARGTAVVTLSEQDAGATQMRYEATLQVGGRLAAVGQRMLDTVSKSLTRQSLDAMNQALQARLAAAPEAEPGAAHTPPTQADFARGVARDVVTQTVTSRRFVWTAAAVVLLLIVLWFLMR